MKPFIVALSGSHRWGLNTPSSDIDILLVTSPHYTDIAKKIHIRQHVCHDKTMNEILSDLGLSSENIADITTSLTPYTTEGKIDITVYNFPGFLSILHKKSVNSFEAWLGSICLDEIAKEFWKLFWADPNNRKPFLTHVFVNAQGMLRNLPKKQERIGKHLSTVYRLSVALYKTIIAYKETESIDGISITMTEEEQNIYRTIKETGDRTYIDKIHQEISKELAYQEQADRGEEIHIPVSVIERYANQKKTSFGGYPVPAPFDVYSDMMKSKQKKERDFFSTIQRLNKGDAHKVAQIINENNKALYPWINWDMFEERYHTIPEAYRPKIHNSYHNMKIYTPPKTIKDAVQEVWECTEDYLE